MFRPILAFVVTLSLVSLSFHTPSVAAESPKKKYRIGAILPLSGSTASLGKYVKNGLQLAYSQLPKEQKEYIEIFYEDDQLQSSKSVSAYQRLKNEKNIDAAFVLGSGIGNAIAPLAERDKKILVAIGASDGSIATSRKYAFVHWVTPETEAREMANEIKRRDYKNLAIATTEQEGAYAVLRAVKTALKNQNLDNRIVAEQSFLPTDSDFKTFIAQMKSRNVDGVIVLLFPGPLSSFAKQVRSLGLGAELAGVELFEDEHEVKASDGALVGQWYVNADVATTDFQELYKKVYNEHPGWGVANAFDTLQLVAEAAAASDGNNESVAQHLEKLENYAGAAGTYSATGDHRFHLPATIKVVREDGFAKLHTDSVNNG